MRICLCPSKHLREFSAIWPVRPSVRRPLSRVSQAHLRPDLRPPSPFHLTDADLAPRKVNVPLANIYVKYSLSFPSNIPRNTICFLLYPSGAALAQYTELRKSLCTWLRQCFRQVEAGVISNSRNKIHQTTYNYYFRAQYSHSVHSAGQILSRSTGPEIILCNRFGDICYCCS